MTDGLRGRPGGRQLSGYCSELHNAELQNCCARWATHHRRPLAHLARARSSGTADRGSTIWLLSSRMTTSNCCPSSTASREEQHVTPTMGTVLSRRVRWRSAPAWQEGRDEWRSKACIHCK